MKRWIVMASVVMIAACMPHEEPIANLPTATFLPIPGQLRLTATPEATRTPLPTFTFTPTVTPIPPTLTNTPVPTATPTVSGIVQSLQRVNVRQGPGENFPFFDSLAPGTGVQVIGQNAAGTWFNVRLEDGREGWISARLLFLPPTPTPIAIGRTPSPDLTALFSAGLPTAVLGGVPITPTPVSLAVTATPIGEPTPTPAAPPTATQPLVPIVGDVPAVNLNAIQQTATALAQGAATATPNRAPATATEQRLLTIAPPGTPAGAAQPTATQPPAVGQQGGTDNRSHPNVFAFCDNVAAFGVPAPTTLRAGQTIDIWWNWYAAEESQLRDHLTHSQVDLRLNGTPIPNVNSFTTPIRPAGDDFVVSYFIPFGPLPAGDYEITYAITWDEPIFDGYQFYGPNTDIPFEQKTCRFRVNP